MFERFDARARRVVVLSQDEARAYNHHYVGTEHLLLGLLQEGGGVAIASLKSLNVSLEAVRRRVEEILERGTETPTGHIAFTPRAKTVLELSYREALQLDHSYVGSEHILLGLIREGEGVAAQVLVKLGADLTTVRQYVVALLDELGQTESDLGPVTASLPSTQPHVRRGFGASLKARLLAGRANKLYDAGGKGAAAGLYAQAVAAAKPASTHWLLLQSIRVDVLEELDQKREASLILRDMVDHITDGKLYRLGTEGIRGSEIRTEVLGKLVDLLGDIREADDELDASRELAEAARASGDASERGRALRRIADNLRARGRTAEAIDTLNLAIVEAKRVSDISGEAHSQVAAAYIEGRHPGADAQRSAVARARRAMELYEHLGDKGDLADAYGLTGRLHRWSGNYQEARDAYSRAVELLRTAGLDKGAEMAQTELASLPQEPRRTSARHI